MTDTEYEFWKQVYIASIRAGQLSGYAEKQAQMAVADYRKLK